jgi:hypothetical protein
MDRDLSWAAAIIFPMDRNPFLMDRDVLQAVRDAFPAIHDPLPAVRNVVRGRVPLLARPAAPHFTMRTCTCPAFMSSRSTTS